MECITKNPFRILGLYADATERDMQRNRAKMCAYLDAEKEVQFEQDFSFLKPVKRSTESIESAVSALESDSDKLIHALFWFVKGSHIDETAFENLKAGFNVKAAEIWEKVTTNEDQWLHHFTAVNNLSTLKLAMSLQSDNLNQEGLSQAINLKLKLIGSSIFPKFVEKTVGTRFDPVADDTMMLFTDNVLNSLEPHLEQRKVGNFEILAMFTPVTDALKNRVRDRLADKPMQRLNNLVLANKKKRKADGAQGIKHADYLITKGLKDLSDLKKLLGPSDLQYQTIADKLAGEVLQTAIDYFHAHEDSSTIDPTITALPLMEKAKAFACGNLTKQRIDENISDLEEWQEEKPEREKYEQIKAHADKLFELLSTFQDKTANINTAKQFTTQCKPYLETIRDKLGKTDELYLRISSSIAGNALGMAISALNEIYNQSDSYVGDTQLSRKALANMEVFSLIQDLKRFDVDEDLEERLSQNYDIVSNNILASAPPRYQTNYSDLYRPTKSASGCLILLLITASINGLIILISGVIG